MSEALRLAALLDASHFGTNAHPVAAELRRLHELNAELVEALRKVLEVWQDDPAYGHGAADKAWELLVKIEASNGS